MSSLPATIVRLFAGFALVSDASAWCGMGHRTVAQEFSDSGAVIVGSVTTQEQWSHDGEVWDGTLYTVQVTEVLKGAPTKTINVYSENSSGRFPMDIGTTYLIFAYRGVFENRASPEWAVDNCGNSTAVHANQQLLADVRHLAAVAAQPVVPADASQPRR